MFESTIEEGGWNRNLTSRRLVESLSRYGNGLLHLPRYRILLCQWKKHGQKTIAEMFIYCELIALLSHSQVGGRVEGRSQNVFRMSVVVLKGKPCHHPGCMAPFEKRRTT